MSREMQILSYADVRTMAMIIHSKIQKMNVEDRTKIVIAGIERGGIHVARELCSFNVDYHFRIIEKGEKTPLVEKLPEKATLVIVDDNVTTGRTFMNLFLYLDNVDSPSYVHRPIVTAALWCESTALYIPHILALPVQRKLPWFFLPWEEPSEIPEDVYQFVDPLVNQVHNIDVIEQEDIGSLLNQKCDYCWLSFMAGDKYAVHYGRGKLMHKACLDGCLRCEHGQR